uniref:Conjugal transfer protein TraD n=1 Tax=Haemonchus placei TaxID=6290 RepID=A0A0N4VYU6_HAEPC
LDETMGSSLMEHATQENELKSSAAKSKQQSARQNM